MAGRWGDALTVDEVATRHHVQVLDADGEFGDAFALDDGDEGGDQRSRTWMAGGFNMVERKLFERLSAGPVPAWQKAALYCLANIDRRGHCPLPSGELTRLLGKKSDVDTRKVVRKAVENGWLAGGSNDRCLIAPYGVEFKAGNRRLRSVCEWH